MSTLADARTDRKRQDFYDRLAPRNLAPLWEVLMGLVPPEARSTPGAVHLRCVLNATRLRRRKVDAEGRIARDHADVNGVAQQHAQDLKQIVGLLGRIRSRSDDLLDMRAPEPGDWLVAVLISKSLEELLRAIARQAGLKRILIPVPFAAW
jgi:hypothetical protein